MPEAAVRAETLRPLSFEDNVAWTLGGTLLYAGAQWGMVIAVARLGTPEALGRFALALSLAVPVLQLANLQLRALQATDVTRRYAFGDYLGLRLVTTVMALLFLAGIALTGGFSREGALVLAAVSAARSCDAVGDVFQGLMQQRERMDRLGISMALKGLLPLLALAAVLVLTGSLVWATAAMAAASLAALAGYDLPAGSWLLGGGSERIPRFRVSQIRTLLRMAVPLGVAMMLVSLQVHLPRLMIGRLAGERELGILAAVTAVAAAGNVLMSALGTAASPRLAAFHASADRTGFRSLLGQLVLAALLLGLVGTAAALVAGEVLLRLLYGPEYARYVALLAWVMAATGLWNVASAFGYAATATRRIRRQPLALAVVTGILAAGCLFLIPRQGLTGAAMAMGLAATAGIAAYASLLAVAPDPQ